jgi:nitrous oxidase accessory protein NosD
VVIEDNIFRGSTGTAIHVGAESHWKEGTHAKDLLIARNMIINCGLGAGCQYGASGIAVVIGAPDTKGTTLHDGVKILDNTIIGTGENRCGISIRNARNIEVKRNRVEGCGMAVETKSVENLNID